MWSLALLPFVVLVRFIFLSAFGVTIAAITTFDLCKGLWHITAEPADDCSVCHANFLFSGGSAFNRRKSHGTQSNLCHRKCI